MNQLFSAPRPLAAERSPWLRGRLIVPGDRGISHRALIIGALALGQTTLTGMAEDDNLLATARAVQALGASVTRHGQSWQVVGLGSNGLLAPRRPLDFGAEGTGLGLAMGLVGFHDFVTRFDGDAALAARPLRHLLAPLREIGVKVLEHRNEGLPLALQGPRTPVPVSHRLVAASAAAKSCLLLAGLSAPGTSRVVEPALTADHTERMLAAFGAEVESSFDGEGNHVVAVEGLPDLRGRHLPVPADPSLACFGLVAALIVPGSDLVLENVLINPTRAGLIDTLLEMGADIEVLDVRGAGGEEAAHLRVRHSELVGVAVPPERGRSMLAEVPAMAVAAAYAVGTTTISGIGALRAGVTDRLGALARALRVNAVLCADDADGLVIEGNGRVRGGGRVVTLGDSRLAMAALVMGMAAEDAITIDDQSPIAARYPGFVRSLEGVGASFIHYSD